MFHQQISGFLNLGFFPDFACYSGRVRQRWLPVGSSVYVMQFFLLYHMLGIIVSLCGFCSYSPLLRNSPRNLSTLQFIVNDRKVVEDQ